MRLPKLTHRHESDGWESTPAPTFPERIAKGFSSTVNFCIICLIVLAFSFSSYALLDTWGVLNKANAVQAQLMELKPSQASLAEMFAELREINPDVVAWVEVDNTNISYPVCRSEEDFTYLDTDVYGEYSVSGSIFITHANKADFSDNYIVLLGHHMQADAMFGPLDKFLDEAFFNENVTARIYLPDRILELETVAMCEADAYDYLLFSAPSYNMKGLIKQISKKALFERGAALKQKEQLIALATCSSGGTNERHILMCRVIEEKAPATVGDEE